MRRRLLSALLLTLTAALMVLGLVPASGQRPVPAAAAVVGGKASPACDARGDLKTGNDCVSHRTRGRARDGVVASGTWFRLDVKVQRPARERGLKVRLQYRPVDADAHAVGPWRTAPGAVAVKRRGGTGTIHAKAPQVHGLYVLRTKLVPRAPRGVRSSAAGAMVSAPSPLAVNNCDESPQDEAIIEYFNEMSFLDSFQLIVRDIGTAYSVALDCPTGDGQPEGFLFQLATADQSQIIDCNSAAITFDKSELDFGTLDDCDERLLCRLLATLSHEVTGTVYSQTTIDIQFTIGMAETFIPTLDPATLPQCTQPLAACLQDGSCQVTTSKQGAIQLCESADACAQPTVTPANEITTGYSYNDQIYFQTAIQSVVKGT